MKMEKEKAEKIIKCSNWLRFFIFAIFLTFIVMQWSPPLGRRGAGW